MLRVYYYHLLCLVFFASDCQSSQDISTLNCRPNMNFNNPTSGANWVEPRIFSQHVLGCSGNLLGWQFRLSQPVTELYADIWRPSEDGTTLELISSELLQGNTGSRYVLASTSVSVQPRDLIGVHGPGVGSLHKVQEDIGETSSRIVSTTDFTVGSVINTDTDTTLDADFAKVAKIRPAIEETSTIHLNPNPANLQNQKLNLTRNNMESSILYTYSRPLPFSILRMTVSGTNMACERSRDSISRGQGSVMVVAGQQPIDRSLRRGPFGPGQLVQCVILNIIINGDVTKCSFECQCSESAGCDVVHTIMMPEFFGDNPTIIDLTQSHIWYLG